jgi:iron-sulfur cluster assembly protein
VIELTPVAAEKLRALRATQAAGSVLRLYVAGRSCCSTRYGLAFDEAAEDDTRLEPAGIPFAVDPQSLPFVEGTRIDFVEAEAGSGFSVLNPTAQGGGCSCGSR